VFGPEDRSGQGFNNLREKGNERGNRRKGEVHLKELRTYDIQLVTKRREKGKKKERGGSHKEERRKERKDVEKIPEFWFYALCLSWLQKRKPHNRSECRRKVSRVETQEGRRVKVREET